MEIKITKEALQWFEENVNLESNRALRFFPSLKRKTKTGLSLGIMPIKPSRIQAKVEHNGIIYYIEKADAWFFEDKDLNISLSEKTNEPKYQ